MFLEASTVFREGVKLQLLIETRDRMEILLSGEVRWSKKYAARYSHKMKSGMGVMIEDFTRGKEVYESFCPRDVCINCTPLPENQSDIQGG